jgi:hypothetical protein
VLLLVRLVVLAGCFQAVHGLEHAGLICLLVHDIFMHRISTRWVCTRCLRAPPSSQPVFTQLPPTPLTVTQEAGNLSILFDVGGVLGGAIAGWLSGWQAQGGPLASPRCHPACCFPSFPLLDRA